MRKLVGKNTDESIFSQNPIHIAGTCLELTCVSHYPEPPMMHVFKFADDYRHVYKISTRNPSAVIGHNYTVPNAFFVTAFWRLRGNPCQQDPWEARCYCIVSMHLPCCDSGSVVEAGERDQKLLWSRVPHNHDTVNHVYKGSSWPRFPKGNSPQRSQNDPHTGLALPRNSNRFHGGSSGK